MPNSRHLVFASALVAMTGAAVLTLSAGSVRPVAQLDSLAILSHAAIAATAATCLAVLMSGRQPVRTAMLLGAGLGALMLGAWAAVLGEFVVVTGELAWAGTLSSAPTLAGILCLGWGLVEWRRVHTVAGDPVKQRERLLRDHRSFDGLTQVADADYLREQLRIEHRQGKRCTLLMLDIDGFHLINRAHGQREGDRLLQAVTHVLLLNLRDSDLLCRYAGDRFGVLLPATELDTARVLGEQLRRAVASLRHHPQCGGQPIGVTMRVVERSLDGDPRQVLKEANRALERRMPRDTDQLASANAA